MDTNTPDNNKVSFGESKISVNDRYSDISWGSKFARWIIKKSNGAVKTEGEANNYLIIISVVIFISAILIALYVGK